MKSSSRNAKCCNKDRRIYQMKSFHKMIRQWVPLSQSHTFQLPSSCQKWAWCPYLHGTRTTSLSLCFDSIFFELNLIIRYHNISEKNWSNLTLKWANLPMTFWHITERLATCRPATCNDWQICNLRTLSCNSLRNKVCLQVSGSSVSCPGYKPSLKSLRSAHFYSKQCRLIFRSGGYWVGRKSRYKFYISYVGLSLVFFRYGPTRDPSDLRISLNLAKPRLMQGHVIFFFWKLWIFWQ